MKHFNLITFDRKQVTAQNHYAFLSFFSLKSFTICCAKKISPTLKIHFERQKEFDFEK
jgi:hypothetical protein